MEHLDFEKIQAYIEEQLSVDDLKQVESHLAECEECLGMYTEIKSLEKTIKSSFKEESPSDSCPEEWEIASVIKDESPQDISDKIKTHIKDCSFCMERSAVYYKALSVESEAMDSPDEWKHKALQTLRTEKTVAEKPKISILERLQDLITGLSTPVPAFAVYGVAILAIAFLFITNIPGKSKLITIASSEKLIVRDSEIPSSFGFSGTGEVKNTGIMKLSSKGDDIYFEWGQIEGAVEYAFLLKDRDGTIYAQSTAKEPAFSTNKDIINEGSLYSWLITGKTSDGKYFEYSGDFVLVE